MPAKSTRKKKRPAAKRTGGVKKAAKRTVKQAADNIAHSAGRAREIADTMITAGETIKQAAEFVDALSGRAAARIDAAQKVRKRKS